MKTSVRRLTFLLLIWGVAAAIAGSVGLIAHLPSLVVPLCVFGMSVGLSIATVHVGWLQDAIASIGVRALLAANLVRFIGGYFIWLYAQGRLPLEFAMRAGWGDIVAAAGAALLLAWPQSPSFRPALLIWNVIAMLDLFVAVGTAGWLNVTRPGSMAEIASLPLALVPLYFVPILMASHVVIFRTLLRGTTRHLELSAIASARSD
jgi:hypothetical protein